MQALGLSCGQDASSARAAFKSDVRRTASTPGWGRRCLSTRERGSIRRQSRTEAITSVATRAVRSGGAEGLCLQGHLIAGNGSPGARYKLKGRR